jgi:hypothetical protein
MCLFKVVSASNDMLYSISNLLCFPGGLRGPSNRAVGAICGDGPFIDPFNPPGGMFREPVLMCLYSWWPGILLEGPALLSIVRCVDVAIAGLEVGGSSTSQVSCARVWDEER